MARGGGGVWKLHNLPTSLSRRRQIYTAGWLLNASSDVSGDIVSLTFNSMTICRISVNKFFDHT